MTNAPRPTRFAGESWRTASAMHARVVGAVIMRDLQTRFGAGYFGFLLGIMIPLAHLTIAIVITTVLGRPAPIGTDGPVFLMTGVLPFILWLYCHRQIMQTIAQNRSLLYFPSVDIFDLFAARIIVEIISGTIVAVTLFSSLSILGHHVSASEWPNFLGAIVHAWVFGVATGLIFGGVSAIWPFAMMLGNVMGPILWVSSGILFLPDLLPNKISDLIYFNPLAHVVDSARISFYNEYTSTFYDPIFLNISILILLIFGLSMPVLLRKIS
ncbi:ABC transporter permease [Xanthobacter versatilis]|uniref:ABC transporter permease n=1 Tax=Xanthobacter autotrophicus (strain ATCC BAA-1158 / Py2) TaxID=78245 RepID=UPI00372757FE